MDSKTEIEQLLFYEIIQSPDSRKPKTQGAVGHAVEDEQVGGCEDDSREANQARGPGGEAIGLRAVLPPRVQGPARAEKLADVLRQAARAGL